VSDNDDYFEEVPAVVAAAVVVPYHGAAVPGDNDDDVPPAAVDVDLPPIEMCCGYCGRMVTTVTPKTRMATMETHIIIIIIYTFV